MYIYIYSSTDFPTNHIIGILEIYLLLTRRTEDPDLFLPQALMVLWYFTKHLKK